MNNVIRFPDLKIENHGSIYLFRPVSQAGREFLHDHAPHEAQWYGLALVIEHHFANDWAMLATSEGLKVA